MFGVSMSELVVVLIIALIVFGPGKLPKVGSALGRAIGEFKRAASGEHIDDESEKDGKNGDQNDDRLG